MRVPAVVPPVGIEAVDAYCGSAVIEVEEIFQGRGLDSARNANLMMRCKSVALPCEDIVSFAVNAAWPIVSSMSPAELATVRTLIVATESGVDFAKAASTYVHDLLGLPRECRLFEVKQACYAGVAALRAAAALIAVEGGRALVIAGDLPVPVRRTYAEPSQGAGAVALLVGDPTVAEIRMDVSGCYAYETTDFSRPRADLDLVDIDLSLLSYINCLAGSFADYARRTGEADFLTSFDVLAMHTPFPGMVKGAHRTLARRLGRPRPDEIEADFTQRVEPSLRFPQQVGNIYSGSTLLAMLSAIMHGPPSARSMGVFSYGGGCASEFFPCSLGPAGPQTVAAAGIGHALDGRTILSLPEYDTIVDDMPEAGFGVRDVVPDLCRLGEVLDQATATRPLALLSAIKGFHREYTWMKEGKLWTPETVR